MLLMSVYLIILFHLIVVSFSSSSVFILPCVALVVLDLVFMPGLYPSAYRAASLAWHAEERSMWLPLVCFFCLCFCLCFLSRPLLATFLSVLFCLLSLLISECIPGLIWFGSVYLVTTAGFVADQ